MARVEAASTSGRPALLSVVEGLGHLTTSPMQLAEQKANIYGFLLWQLGSPEFQPGGAR